MSVSAEVRLIQANTRSDKPQIWIAKRIGATVHVTWGCTGGKMQNTSVEHSGINEGKSNERSPEQAAQDSLDRLAKLKRREGYKDEGLSTFDRAVTANALSLDFDDLPENFCLYKPNKVVSSRVEKLMAAGKAVYTRKRDGEMFVAVVNSKGGVDIYSRRMHKSHDKEKTPWAARFQHIVADVQALNLRTKTMLLVEMIADRSGVDDHRHVTTVTRALTDAAKEQQKKEGYLSAYVWDVAFFASEPSASISPVGTRLKWIATSIKGKHLRPVEQFTFPSQEAALEFATKYKFEGWVVVDPEAIYEDKAWSFNGKASRPSTCCKLKPDREEDFLVDFNPAEGIGHYGTGKRAKGVGAVAVYSKDKDGELRYMGDVGTGLTDVQVAEFADKKLYPMVWQLGFARLTPDGKLWHPRFLRVRDDKDLDDIHEFVEEELE